MVVITTFGQLQGTFHRNLCHRPTALCVHARGRARRERQSVLTESVRALEGQRPE